MRIRRWLRLIVVCALVLGQGVPMVSAEAPSSELWMQQGAFDGWHLDGVEVVGSRLVGRSGDGVATSPVVNSASEFVELIPSWNAETPDGSWVDVELRANLAGGWTRWYGLGRWSSSDAAQRRSVDGQDDADARVLTDTLRLASTAREFQARVRFGGPPGASLGLLAVSTSRRGVTPTSAPGPGRGRVLDVPERSQMAYPGGGEVWCSPTSVSMVLGYWARVTSDPSVDIAVPDAASATWDPVYDGNGNWPFNTALAATRGMVAYVHRFPSLVVVERWIAAGVPIVASIAWDRGQLDDVPVPSTDGHLLVVIGFDDHGDVVVNDPAGHPERGIAVRRRYRRDQFERLWLATSGGTVYVIHPPAWPRP